MSVLTERVNASSVLAELPLRADRAQQMDELAPVLATPATAVAFAAGVGVGVAVTNAFGAGLAAGGSKQPS
ncbi:hypothetical protein RFN58_04515 [Streptomyces iakyrus]|uniref:hypothetical protein n=1 Tax=Streptomyces iakyrus TaxID=68219 RepID=UPI000525875A|nr:hypothetical protein [Streptomyces iakyrus]